MEKPKIVLVLPRGEAIRNFVLSGMASQLKKESELTILSVIPNAEIEKILKSSCHQFFELIPVQQKWIQRFMLEWLDMVHGRMLWSGAAKYRWLMRDFEARSMKGKIKRLLKKALVKPFASQKGISFISKIETLFQETIFPSVYYTDLFKKLKPDVVFNGSHVHSVIAIPAIHAARKLKIKTSTFLFSWDNLTSQGRIVPEYDHYMVWNRSIAEDLKKIYPSINDNQVSITGTPQFDFHFHASNFWTRSEYCSRIGIDQNRPIILYTTGMPNHMPGEDIIIEGIADICAALDQKPQLVVRVYPKDSTGRFEKLKKDRKDICFPPIPWESNWLTPLPEDIILWSNMLKHCEAGINIASTVTLELCMFDKPAINVNYNPPKIDISPVDFPRYYTWDHYKPIVDSGAIYLASSTDELSAFLQTALNLPDEKSVERRKLLKDFFENTLDGASIDRIRTKLVNIASLNN